MLRESPDLICMVKPEAGTTALDHKIMAERASSLSAAKHKVIVAIAALASAKADRADQLPHAQTAVWASFVQRELIGFRKYADIIQNRSIPPEVLAELGAMVRRQ